MTIHIEADDLIRKITKLSQLKELGHHVKAAAVHVKGKIAHYPAQQGWGVTDTNGRSRRVYRI